MTGRRQTPKGEKPAARVEEHVFENFASQRDVALRLATGDWVLFVDADERVTEELTG